MKIRKAKLEDLTDIVALNQKLFDSEYKKRDKSLDCSWPQKNKNYFKKGITSKNFFTLVAVDNGKIVGYFLGSIKKAESYRNIKKMAEADDAYILPPYQRKGIGSEFYKRFLMWAKEKGATRVKAVVSAKNKPSLNWTRKFGFKDYDVVMEKRLK